MIGAEASAITKISGYGFGAELVPLMDVEDSVTLKTVWDRMVPKSTITAAAGVATVDVDWDDVDATPQIEPGEVNMNKLVGLAEATKQIIKPRLEFSSWATNKGGWVAGTPDVFNPSDFKTFRGARTVKAEVNSYALAAVSSPTFDNEATSESTHSAARFSLMENLRKHIEMAPIVGMGLTETGAETPWDTLANTIADMVSPNLVQPATAIVITQTWTFFAKIHWVCDSGESSIPNVLEAY